MDLSDVVPEVSLLIVLNAKSIVNNGVCVVCIFCLSIVAPLPVTKVVPLAKGSLLERMDKIRKTQELQAEMARRCVSRTTSCVYVGVC